MPQFVVYINLRQKRQLIPEQRGFSSQIDSIIITKYSNTNHACYDNNVMRAHKCRQASSVLCLKFSGCANSEQQHNADITILTNCIEKPKASG